MEELPKKLSRFGSKPGLERIARLMDALGHPERKMKVILVTGTNGKGSVTSFLAGILKEAGFRVGSYFSPHLKKYNERFKINGKDISDAKLKKYEKTLLALFEKQNYEMTEFEALTAIAYKYFADENCDFAVMEIGMGGRLDATNIADGCISIITNVDLEHTDYLGKTIEEVAFEKAGIMKRGVEITGAGGKALGAIKKIANEKKIELRVLDEKIFAKAVEVNNAHNIFNYLGHGFFQNLETMLIGRHQIENAALAVSAAEELGIDENAIRSGLKKAKNDGRLQIVGKNPSIVIDAAHNVHGIKELIPNLNLFDYEKLIAVFGVMKDKDWKEMLRLLGPHCDMIIATESEEMKERAVRAEKIAKEAAMHTKSIAKKEPEKALALAKKSAKKSDLILVCGSIYMISELLGAKRR